MYFSISPCQPLHAVGYPFDCPNIVCLTPFPNINQTSKRNCSSQLEKISRYPKENEPEVFLNTYPYTNLAYNTISAYLTHLVTTPVTIRRASPHWKNFLPPEKMSWTYCMHNHCFRCYMLCNALLRDINVKFGLPSELFVPLDVPSWLRVCW